MGREVRRVIPNWQHPMVDSSTYDSERGYGGPQPMRDQDFESAAEEWIAANEEWENGNDPSRTRFEKAEGYRCYYWEYNGGPPSDRVYYRPKWTPEEATWFQVYETVSEGTPVTPAFATEAELVDYLVTNGDYWDQKRGQGGWSRPNAEKFVKAGFAMSMMVSRTASGVEIKEPRDGQFD